MMVSRRRFDALALGLAVVAGIGMATNLIEAKPPSFAKNLPEKSELQPRELGRIKWMRGFDIAARRAEREGKPLLVLFQEVPGCHTCLTYGDKVLSHPLIIDAAQMLFIPVAIYNNIKGDDEKTLTSFKEPAWNNPVVRVMTHDRKPLASRVTEDYTVLGIASAMTDALGKANRAVPEYLALLVEELDAAKRGTERATFVMHCFWEGEGALGNVPGVVSTMAGFMGKDEIVEVLFDPKAVSFDALFGKARSMKCADKVFARTDAQLAAARGELGDKAIRSNVDARPDRDPKYYLAQTTFRHVPMTELQAMRVNAAIPAKKDPKHYLSPGQLRLLAAVEKSPSAAWPDAIGAADLVAAWAAAGKVRASLR